MDGPSATPKFKVSEQVRDAGLTVKEGPKKGRVTDENLHWRDKNARYGE
jgi:hypothetical protein